MRKCFIVKWFYLIKENIEKSIVIKSNREAIMQFRKADMPIGRKGTLIEITIFFFWPYRLLKDIHFSVFIRWYIAFTTFSFLDIFMYFIFLFLFFFWLLFSWRCSRFLFLSLILSESNFPVIFFFVNFWFYINLVSLIFLRISKVILFFYYKHKTFVSIGQLRKKLLHFHHSSFVKLFYKAHLNRCF